MSKKETIQERLEEKAVDIKGKKYVLVSDRIVAFNELYPKGTIKTELITEPKSKMVIIKATIEPEEGRIFTGHSQAIWGDGFINKSSALENAETSAVGRALALMGIGVIDSIASVDEINKANTSMDAHNTVTEMERQIEDARQEAIKIKSEQSLIN